MANQNLKETETTSADQLSSEENQLTHDKLETLSTDNFIELVTSEDEILFVINKLFLEKENQLFRNGIPPAPEAKIMSTIGNPHSQTIDVRECFDFDGLPVRTKAASKIKIAEIFEVITAIDGYVYDKPGFTVEHLFSELADIFYNVFHLMETDEIGSSIYETWLREIARVLNVSFVEVGWLIFAKYKKRMYDENGEYAYGDENNEIRRVLELIFPQPDSGQTGEWPLEDRVKVDGSTLLKLVNSLWTVCLIPRLTQLKGEHNLKISLIGAGLMTLSDGDEQDATSSVEVDTVEVTEATDN